jgi:hypothetical protein
MIQSWLWPKSLENCLESSWNVATSMKGTRRVWQDNLRFSLSSLSWVWEASADMCWSRCEIVHALNCKLIQCNDVTVKWMERKELTSSSDSETIIFPNNDKHYNNNN